MGHVCVELDPSAANAPLPHKIAPKLLSSQRPPGLHTTIMVTSHTHTCMLTEKTARVFCTLRHVVDLNSWMSMCTIHHFRAGVHCWLWNYPLWPCRSQCSPGERKDSKDCWFWPCSAGDHQHSAPDRASLSMDGSRGYYHETGVNQDRRVSTHTAGFPEECVQWVYLW